MAFLQKVTQKLAAKVGAAIEKYQEQSDARTFKLCN